MSDSMSEVLRLGIYRGFAAAGRAPSLTELAADLGTDAAEVGAGLTRLASDRHVVLDENGAIVLAHPFATQSFGFAVMGRDTLWWGGCAWDSFAIPNLVPDEPDVLVSTRCPACDSPLAWVVGRSEPPVGDEVAHFLVPMAHVWDDVVTTCANQRLFCSRDCVQRWLRESGHVLGYIMDLGALWRLAQHWYAGRLDEGYVRREPDQAREYFRQVGLTGPFWGLPSTPE